MILNRLLMSMAFGKKIEFYRHHESLPRITCLLQLGVKKGRNRWQDVTANSTSPQGELNFFFFVHLTGEDDPHPQVTQRSRHLHTEVSVILDINGSYSCRLVSLPARLTLRASASIDSCCLRKWKHWILLFCSSRVKVRDFHSWLACWTEKVLPCLVGLFDCIVCDPQETLTMCHVGTDAQYKAQLGPARPGPSQSPLASWFRLHNSRNV